MACRAAETGTCTKAIVLRLPSGSGSTLRVASGSRFHVPPGLLSGCHCGVRFRVLVARHASSRSG